MLAESAEESDMRWTAGTLLLALGLWAAGCEQSTPGAGTAPAAPGNTGHGPGGAPGSVKGPPLTGGPDHNDEIEQTLDSGTSPPETTFDAGGHGPPDSGRNGPLTDVIFVPDAGKPDVARPDAASAPGDAAVPK